MITVFYSFIEDFNLAITNLDFLGAERKKYVEKITDNKRKYQSISVWKLLRLALKERFNITNNNFFCNNNKWQLSNNEANFSLSHSDRLISVAVSIDGEVGIDCEKISNKILKVNKLFKNDNNIDLNSINDLTLSWTRKESNYKFKSGKLFSTEKVSFNSDEYLITTCSNENCVVVKEIKFQNLLKYTI